MLISYKKKLKSTKTNSTIFYKFAFMSLISPVLITYHPSLLIKEESKTLYANLFPKPRFKKNYKLLAKNSYMMLAWLSLMFNNINPKIKVKQTASENISYLKKAPKFFVFPLRRKIFTMIKGPMADKKRGQEQFNFHVYYLCASIKTSIDSNSKILSFDESLLFLILLRKIFPFFETNFIYLRHYVLYFYAKDKIFFNYKFFLKNK